MRHWESGWQCFKRRRSLKKRFETFRWISDTLKRKIFDYEIAVFKVRLSMLRREANFKLSNLTRLDLPLTGLYAVMSLIIIKCDLLRVLVLIDRPMIRY